MPNNNGQLSPAALADLASSGLSPEIIGQPLSRILRDVIPFDAEVLEAFFPPDSFLWQHGKDEQNRPTKTLRPKDGYGWQYGNSGTVRIKNLDKTFVVKKNGVPVTDKHGRPKMHRYLSPKGDTMHVYLLPEDHDAANSKSAAYFVIEGEKKKRMLTALLELLPQFPQSHISADKRYCVIGLQGVYSTETAEMDALTGGTKEGQDEDIPYHNPDFSPLKLTGREVFFAFDADAAVNPDVARAELRLVGLLFLRGAALRRMKSLEWDMSRGKGLDDYLMTVKKSALGDGPIFDETGTPIVDHHPMLDGLNQLMKLSTHPFKRWSKLPLDFVIRAVTSGVKAGFVMTEILKAELADVLKSEGFKSVSKSVILKAITQQIARHLQEKRQTDDLMTELRLSEKLAEQYAGKLLFNETAQRWMWFDGKKWNLDGKKHPNAIQAAKEILRRADTLFEGDDVTLMGLRDQARKMENHMVLSRIVDHASTIESLRKDEEDFDAVPYLLNLQNCVFDMKARTVLKHTPEQLHSKICAVEYQSDATCPKWMAFLNTIFMNTPYITTEAIEDLRGAFPHLSTKIDEFTDAVGVDIAEEDWLIILNGVGANPSERRDIDARCRKQYEKVRFLQQCLGLSLTGYANEKIFIFAHGAEGNNGKSTIFNVFERMLDKYFTRIPVAALLQRGNFKSDLNDAIAEMRGARMVVTDEFSDGVLDVSQLKSLTGAEMITCRRPHEHTLHFLPTSTTWGFGNTRPRILVQNDPVWSRLMLLEFPVSLTLLAEAGKFVVREMSEVVEEFLQEAPGILRWALEGYSLYAEEKLLVPDCVKADSSAYRQAQDSVKDFLDEMCVMLHGGKTSRPTLWRTYVRWCDETKTRQKQRSQFFDDILSRPGVTGAPGGGNMFYFYGIVLRDSRQQPHADDFDATAVCRSLGNISSDRQNDAQRDAYIENDIPM